MRKIGIFESSLYIIIVIRICVMISHVLRSKCDMSVRLLKCVSIVNVTGALQTKKLLHPLTGSLALNSFTGGNVIGSHVSVDLKFNPWLDAVVRSLTERCEHCSYIRCCSCLQDVDRLFCEIHVAHIRSYQFNTIISYSEYHASYSKHEDLCRTILEISGEMDASSRRANRIIIVYNLSVSKKI